MKYTLHESIQRKAQAEQGAYHHPFGTRFSVALCYPNTYEVGMSNLGMQIIYKEINERPDTLGERFFLPDKKELPEYHRTQTPLVSVESGHGLWEYDLIGFAVTFEMDYFHIPELLSLGRVPVLAKDRTDQDPLVIMGGPCAFFNPEPLSVFGDAFIIGEGEGVIHQLLDVYQEGKRKGLKREEQLRQLAQIPGVYVPSCYDHHYDEHGRVCTIVPKEGAPLRVQRQWAVQEEYGETVIATPYTEFGEMYLVEIARGCGRHCRFCMAGYCYRRPRMRSLESICQAVERGKKVGKKIGLMGAAISDYPHIDELIRYIRAQDMPFSCASLRADSITPTIVKGLAESGQKTITLAPEAGSTAMRNVINKGITNEDMYRSIDLAVAAGIRHVRLYIMIGLPWEEEEDIDAIITMTKAIRAYMDEHGNMGRLTLSVNVFIPKPMTPFQWLPMIERKEGERRLKKIQDAFKKTSRIEVRCESVRESYIQGVLARGDRKIGDLLYRAWELGGYKAWKQAAKEQKVDVDAYLYQPVPVGQVQPWDILDMGLADGYMEKELEAAKQRKYTIPCFSGCNRCTICGGQPWNEE